MTCIRCVRACTLYRLMMVAFIFLSVCCGCAMRQVVAPDFFPNEEKRLAAMMAKAQDNRELSDWHIQRARLRVRADNPRPDYDGALKDFTAGLNLNPGRRDGGNISDWIAVLSMLASIERSSTLLESKNKAVLNKLASAEQVSNTLKSKYIKAQQQNLSLKSVIARLKKQEQELRNTIEALQSLELQMEHRRQQLR